MQTDNTTPSSGIPEEVITLEKALTFSEDTTRELCKTYWNAGRVTLMGLIKIDRQYTKAQGMSVWDQHGNEYLDFLGGFGALNTGHNHPKINAALREVEEIPNILQTSISPLVGALAKTLANITPGDLQRCFFCNSGAEAVESSLKLARLSTGRSNIIYTENSFHGKTFGALSVTGRDKYQKPFQPLLQGCRVVPYGDLDALEKALQDKTAAGFIVEPIQGEGGINVPPSGYLKEAAGLCRKYGTLFIADEVQTGMGRTGKMFACEHENVEPDVMCLSKSLGGGIIPLGACISTDRAWKKAYGSIEGAALHSSTFEGNTRAMAAALTAIEVIYEENLMGNAQTTGQYFLDQLKSIQKDYPLVKDVRGKGLLLGIQFAENKGKLASVASFGLLDKLSDEFLGSLVAGELFNKHHIITAYTLNNPNVIRLEPPLIVTKEQVDKAISALRAILDANRGFLGLAKSGVKNIFKSINK